MKKMNVIFWQLAGILGLFLLINTSAIAHKKVVFVPLGGGKKSTSCTAPDEVLSLGKCWKDRNLGATRVASSSTDSAAYGDLYQWGRLGDGHQLRSSSTTPTNSDNDVPGHSLFITENASPYDWRTSQNDNLWQGLGGVNNPCPKGFRLPTATEWNVEWHSWVPGNSAGAFASPLKLVAAGYRDYTYGMVYLVGGVGHYWSSTVSGIRSQSVFFLQSMTVNMTNYRATGLSVRCLKD